MTGWLLEATGLAVLPGEAEARARVLCLLVDVAVSFLRGGGIVTPDAWLDLSVEERHALERAGQIVASERAALTGLASQGPLGAASAFSGADGGAARRRVLLEQAAERAASSPVIGG